MAKYRVGFDAQWQESFDDEADAVSWAEEASDEGRTVYVVRWGWPRRRLIAVFPRSREAEAKESWRKRRGPSAGAPTGGF